MGLRRLDRTRSSLPWRQPRHEVLLVALVAAVTLSVVMPVGAQDASRWCLTKALVHGSLSADDCLASTQDRSHRNGHLYSNKAPGMSLLGIPAAEAVRLPSPARWQRGGDPRLWAVRVLTSGLAMIVCVFLVGRVSEGLVPGWGGAVLVTFGLGTIVSSFAASSFGHVPTAALGLAAFVLAWDKRPFLAGLAGGAALLVEYEAAPIALVVGAYTALLGWRSLRRYAAGLAPGVVLLAGYDWLAFGAPWHSPLSYSDNPYAAAHESGLLGLHLPYIHAIRLVLVADRGLLVVSPILIAALLGLVGLWRRGFPAEAAVCALIVAAFLAAECSYYSPYGGDSPGARFFIPALPFLVLGLSRAFASRPALTSALATVSIIASTAIALTWPAAANSGTGHRWTVWRELALFVANGSSSTIASWPQKTVFSWVGAGRLGASAIVFALGLTALGVALRNGWSARAHRE